MQMIRYFSVVALFLLVSVSLAQGEKSPEKDGAQPVATLTIIAENSDGPARGSVEILAAADGESLTLATKPVVQGRAAFELPPGTYRVVVTSADEIIRQTKSLDAVELKAGDKVERKIYFERGKVETAAVDKDGTKFDGVLALESYDPEQAKFRGVPGSVMVAGGRAAIHLPPGKYRLRFTPDGIVGAQEETSPEFEITDKVTVDYKPKIEFGALTLASGDYEGPLKSRFTILALREQAGKPAESLVFSRDLDGRSAALKIAPGKYRLTVDPDPNLLLGAAAKTFDDVDIAPGAEREIKAVFEKGRAVLCVSAFDKVAGRIDLQKWHDAQKNYSNFRSAELKDGDNAFNLAPGRYRIVAVDTAVTPDAEYPWAEIEVADKSLATSKIHLERGKVKVLANAKGKVIVERRTAETSRRICEAALSDGSAEIPLRPGTYRLTLLPEGADKGSAGDWFEIKDRAWLMRSFDAGSCGPEVDLWGPFEVGDDDGLLEAKERVTFSMRFGGARFAGAKVTLLVPMGEGKYEEREIAEISKPGEDKDRERALEGEGEYILRIVAWDSAEPRRETVVERRFTVRPRD